ncbi:autotransporter domain-containing protein [Flammeovirga agarivorans]|uniref:Autotransporter outer membrane beta-barrel domain-containing protein n=1 Tax=Flammeovirga agarivorans TaxID=2726742 RepID=A0A7X8SIP0_9BACT|nr:autotransporter domain-containing protein [Flammeovirga agarivorans]NLR90973.1 autotransporter outer membrane beta-barrel domain-containing protein [Flammeovirga agarivorans]
MKNLFITIIVFLGIFNQSFAQNNYPARTEADIDSLDYLFPAMGSKIKKMGHSVPMPTGLMFNYVYQQSNIRLEDFKMGTDPNNLHNMDFVGFSPAHSETMAYNVRLDLWLLPFLNVYGNYAYSTSEGSVQITDPLNFPVNTTPETQSYGFGFTTAYGWNDWFMAANFNFTWSDNQALETMTKSQIISVRFGRNFKVGKNGHIAPSVGVQYQHMSPYSLGSIKTSKIKDFLNNDVVQGAKQNLRNKYDEWYDGLSRPEKKIVSEAIDAVQNKVGEHQMPEKLYYSFNKYKMSNFAAIVGVSYFYKNRHMFRAETAVGYGYVNAVFSYNYRFGLYKRREKRLSNHLKNIF